MEQRTGSKLGKEYDKAVYCNLAYLIYMQSTSCQTPGRMSPSWNQDRREKHQQLRYADDTTLLAETEEEQEWLDEGERNVKKTDLKQHSKN